MCKQHIRQEIIESCRNIDSKNFAMHNLLANIRHIIDKATRIVVYRSITYEVNLDTIIKYAFELNKQLYQPICYKSNMYLMEYDEDMVDIFATQNPVNFMESTTWYNVDLIIVPIVAVDMFGYRLGRGGGFYDRVLFGVETDKIVAVGYNEQYLNYSLKDKNALDEWDLRVGAFASDTKLQIF